MLKRSALLAALITLTANAGPSVNVLSNTDHIVGSVTGALAILGNATSIVDQTCPTGTSAPVDCGTSGGPSFITPPATFIAMALSVGGTPYFGAGGTTPSNHSPYGILNQSSAGYSLAVHEQPNYAALAAGVLYEMAYCGGPSAGDAYPPVAMSTVLPNTSAGVPLGSLTGNTCGYAQGIEFSMIEGYKGFATGSPSGTTEAMSAVFATLAVNHPSWTFGDMKACLRQTASSWTTGYAPVTGTGSATAFGYGNVNYDACNAFSSPASFFLQAPGFTIGTNAKNKQPQFTMQPFLQTRCSKVALYIDGTWPNPATLNELTAAQLTATGATFAGQAACTGTPSITLPIPAIGGTHQVRAVTLDATGNASRVESYSPQSVTQPLVLPYASAFVLQ